MEIKKAERKDASIILQLIIELAKYEKLEHEVIANEQLIEEWIFTKKRAHVLLGYEQDRVIGYCLYFYNFSTFLGKAGIYIEDIYVREQERNKGYGKAFFKAIAKLAMDEECDRIDWSCLKWNQSSIEFYESMNASKQEEWVGFRLDKQAIKKLK